MTLLRLATRRRLVVTWLCLAPSFSFQRSSRRTTSRPVTTSRPERWPTVTAARRATEFATAERTDTGPETLSEDVRRLLRRRLLTFEEEQSLGTAIQDYRRLTLMADAAAADGGKRPTDAELAKMAKISVKRLLAMRESALESRETMLLSNMRLVVNLSRRAQRTTSRFKSKTGLDRDGLALSFNDLVAEGFLGLAVAVDRFEPQRGFRFSTYATWWVRQSVQKATRKREIVSVPVHLQHLARRVANATRLMTDDTGYPPSQAELAAYLGATAKHLALARLARQTTLSLDAPLQTSTHSRDFDVQLIDLLEDRYVPEEVASFHELRNALDDAMHFALSASERDVLRLRLGLDDGGRRTRIEVGRIFGADAKRVRQIERVALKKLKLQRHRKLRDYIA